jgi:enoyl-CoA hydratase/carnithine racemase
MSEHSPLVDFARRGAGGWLTLNRPRRRNALTPKLLADLGCALDACDDDPLVRAVVLTGAGDAFCAGADLDYLLGRLDEPDGCDTFIAELLDPLWSLLRRLRDSGRPTIAAVNGACFAGGVELLVTGDLVIASEDATFCDAHALRGLAPAVGGTAGLVAALGAPRARRMLMLAESFGPHELAAAGLVSEVVPADHLTGRVDELTALVASRSPASIAAAKRAVQRCEPRSWDEMVAEDMAVFRRHWNGPDMREGILAFLERRDPRYAAQGRLLGVPRDCLSWPFTARAAPSPWTKLPGAAVAGR